MCKCWLGEVFSEEIFILPVTPVSALCHSSSRSFTFSDMGKSSGGVFFGLIKFKRINEERLVKEWLFLAAII